MTNLPCGHPAQPPNAITTHAGDVICRACHNAAHPPQVRRPQPAHPNCTCGHLASQHDADGCRVWPDGTAESACPCTTYQPPETP